MPIKEKQKTAFWKAAHYKQLEEATSFRDLGDVLKAVAESLPENPSLVSGPISSGGLGSIERNLERFQQVTHELINSGVTILSIMPFQDHIFRIARMKQKEWTSELNQKLLDEMFLPLFENHDLDRLYMIPGWESSHGATWEHAQATERGIEIIYLPDNYITDGF